jgi:hypothetical protein
MNEIYNPILMKIESWINYEKNKPTTSYEEDRKRHDKYRAENDLDCILCNGDLKADTIFSLWLPLRFSIFYINQKNYKYIKHIAGYDMRKELDFLEALIRREGEVISKLLPEHEETTILLSELFSLGQTRANVMLLPTIGINSERGQKPYYDYMPYFLDECFKGGHFAKYFSSDDSFREFVKEEKLEYFFEGEVLKENIMDLANTGNIKYGIPNDINILIKNYISILRKRSSQIAITS